MQLHAARVAGCDSFIVRYRDAIERLRCVRLATFGSHCLQLGLLVSYKPASFDRLHIYWRPTQYPIYEICVYLKLSFWEVVREITSSCIQSALAFLCRRMRAAEESSGPFA